MNERQEQELRMQIHHLRRAQEQHTQERLRFPNQPKPSTERQLNSAVEGIVDLVRKLVGSG